ncbi:MAG: hypothetical protein J0H55_00525 [Chitinophagaceae bacterium]|nr:hypothetical protein [Chitinophagaceae bacterium]
MRASILSSGLYSGRTDQGMMLRPIIDAPEVMMEIELMTCLNEECSSPCTHPDIRFPPVLLFSKRCFSENISLVFSSPFLRPLSVPFRVSWRRWYGTGIAQV